MDYRTFIAFQVWAIDTDQLCLPLDAAWDKFKWDAEGLKFSFTDPNDPLLFCKNLIDKDPVDVLTDYALRFAKSRIVSALPDERYDEYGKLTDTILKVA